MNQAAERIIFSNNGDGTITAVIQILHQGPSQNFSWLLPISTVPKSDEDIGVALGRGVPAPASGDQSALHPDHSRRRRECRDGFPRANGVLRASRPAPRAPPSTATRPGVTVEASGVVGSFEWTVISLDASLSDPAAAATAWLEQNSFDVSPGAQRLIGPYLQEGSFLLALKLTKGSDTGSIRPIVLTYDAKLPMIPIKLTAVAANNDMGVMTWVLGEQRAVPRNYLSLELNEARIDWLTSASNYNEVVTEAADEAGGRGFVTEYAGTTSALSKVIWTDSDEQQWISFRDSVNASLAQIFENAYYSYSGYSGFWDAVREVVMLSNGATFDDLKSCPTCYGGNLQFSPAEVEAALEGSVIEPMRRVQRLFDARPYVTRLYSTLSAGEMTEDPLFTFNGDLSNVSNVHTAERAIECSRDVSQFEAPWRILLPQGDLVRGTGTTWPVPESDPPNARVMRLSESGSGAVVLDNRTEIGPGSPGTTPNIRARLRPAPAAALCRAAPRTPSPARGSRSERWECHCAVTCARDGTRTRPEGPKSRHRARARALATRRNPAAAPKTSSGSAAPRGHPAVRRRRRRRPTSSLRTPDGGSHHTTCQDSVFGENTRSVVP